MTADATLGERLAALEFPVAHSTLDPVVQDSPWDSRASRTMPGVSDTRDRRGDDDQVRRCASRAHPSVPVLQQRSRRRCKERLAGRKNARRYQEILRERGWGHVETLQRTHPPIHTSYRHLVAKAFLPRRMTAMAPHIDDVTRELIDGLIRRWGMRVQYGLRDATARPSSPRSSVSTAPRSTVSTGGRAPCSLWRCVSSPEMTCWMPSG